MKETKEASDTTWGGPVKGGSHVVLLAIFVEKKIFIPIDMVHKKMYNKT